MPVNAEYGDAWTIWHLPSREVITGKIIYVDDETGELWKFEERADGGYKLEGTGLDRRPVVEKLILGPGTIRLQHK